MGPLPILTEVPTDVDLSALQADLATDGVAVLNPAHSDSVPQLVQVVKDERGAKGAALTTWLSLAGRYCVLMPNTGKGGGISRKISNAADRKRLKSIMAELALPPSMGCIVRTAGLKRTKAEIRRDFDYLTRLWDEIREATLKSTAPALIYQDSDLIKRAIRDLYNKDLSFSDLALANEGQRIDVAGFKEAAERFKSEANIDSNKVTDIKTYNETDDQIDQRIAVRSEIENGNIEQAIRLINDFYPELIDNNRHIHFKLQVCRVFGFRWEYTNTASLP